MGGLSEAWQVGRGGLARVAGRREAESIDSVAAGLLRSDPSMKTTRFKRSRKTLAQVSVCPLVFLLLVLAPFAGALEVHHALAAADHDGHEHSDFDLCQWVQHHTGHSLPAVMPQVERYVLLLDDLIPLDRFFLTAVLVPGGSPRAPPQS